MCGRPPAARTRAAHARPARHAARRGSARTPPRHPAGNPPAGCPARRRASRPSSTRIVRRPSLLQAPMVWRAELDWMSRPTTTVSGCSAMVRARRNSRLRSLLPPNATPVRSSRLMKMRGPPRARVRFGASSIGVGVRASFTRGMRAMRSRIQAYLGSAPAGIVHHRPPGLPGSGHCRSRTPRVQAGWRAAWHDADAGSSRNCRAERRSAFRHDRLKPGVSRRCTERAFAGAA